ncbi:coiled-coil domain-containing protein 137 [Linepithema humile]|uniref:coiled-coil domain-containing protein 137 n=1 Tax=Linepithema humile TaxID=83485 RepID=UPI0006238877|nr:PREDICTED: coiled-coil domain-containing protein 137 [Linepithema humile]
MGRKIPAKKHRGVKDPEKQRVKRLAELESRTNAPPKDTDEQAIPKSLEHVIKLKEAAKTSSGILKRKRKRKRNALICVGQQHLKPNLHPKAKPEKVVPVFQQQPGESGQQFFRRVSRDTNAFLQDTAFENKYKIDIERNPETGRIQNLTKRKREKDDIDIETLQAKHKNIKKRKKTVEDSARLTKSEKRKLKERLRKEKKLEDDDEFKRLQDKVAFGEVVHEPPRLKIKSQNLNQERKPKNLLLNSLLEDSKTSSAPKVIDRSGKRKNLPTAERRRLEKQQSEIIAAYRQLKSQRLINRSS